MILSTARRIGCFGFGPKFESVNVWLKDYKIMDEATDFEDKESLSHPRNQVYAIFHDVETARRAAKELNQIGIEPAGIGLLVGKRGRRKTGCGNR